MKYAKPMLALAGLLASIMAANAANAAVFPAGSPVIQNGSFENLTSGSYVYNPVVSGVTFNAGSGIQRNGSWLFPDAPDGTYTAFLQGTPSTIAAISFALSNLTVGQAYTISFKASARPDPGKADYASNPFTVAVNGAALGQYDTKLTSWKSFTTNAFVATASTASLSFTGSRAIGAENDVGLDSVTIAAVPEPATWAMMLVGFGMIGAASRYRRRGGKAVLA